MKLSHSLEREDAQPTDLRTCLRLPEAPGYARRPLGPLGARPPDPANRRRHTQLVPVGSSP